MTRQEDANKATVKELLEGLSDAEIRALCIDALQTWRRKHPTEGQFSVHGALGLEVVPLLIARKGRPLVDSDTLSGLKEPFITEQSQPWFVGVTDFLVWFTRKAFGDAIAWDKHNIVIIRLTRLGMQFLDGTEDNPLLESASSSAPIAAVGAPGAISGAIIGAAASAALPQDLTPSTEPFSKIACQLTRETHPKERCLRVDDYAVALAAVMDASSDEFSFAIYGHWGRGKTFLMKRLAEVLPTTYRTVWFSAWKYRTAPETWVHLYETFARAARQDGFLRAAPRAGRAYLSKAGAWSIVVMLLWLIVSLYGLGLLPVLIGALGIIGLLKAYAVFRWTGQLPRVLLSLPRHVDKLGLQATIGEDLTSLLQGWIPIVSKAKGVPRISSSIPGKIWVVIYLLEVVGVAAVLHLVLQGREYGLLPLHPPPLVSWVAIVFVVIAGCVLLIWILTAGRTTKRIALVVDDLDRCEPATMLELIESLKLLLEDPEISARVQVVMLVEESALEHAILQRYKHHTKVRPVRERRSGDPLHGPSGPQTSRVVLETIEKLFIAHLRLPPLSTSELKEAMGVYVQQYPLHEQLTTVQTAAPQEREAALAATGARAQTGPRSGPPVSDASGLFTPDERAALIEAVELLVKQERGNSIGPRALRTFLTRYQLAKFLLAMRGASCTPQALVNSLLASETGATKDPDVAAVVAEVS
jgi:hypothetical protein